MKNNIFILLFFILTNLSFASAQTAAQGEELFNNQDYAAAKDVYAALVKRDASALNNFRYARCCFELGEYETALVYFQRTSERYPLKHFYIGEIYFETYRFKDAEKAYNTYLGKLKPDDKEVKIVSRRIELTIMAADLLNRTEDITIIDSISVDKEKLLNFMKFTDEIGSLKQETIQNDSSSLDKITFTTQRGDRKIYSNTVTEQGTDILESIKLFDRWSESVSISSAINTSANENYPFLLLDGITLYFASDGEKSIGGYDIFITRYSPATKRYVQPENIGMPFNSPANDYMMIIDENRNIGWFASDRRQPEGKVMIYKFVKNDFKTLLKTDDDELLRSRASLSAPLMANDSLLNIINKLEQTTNKTSHAQTQTSEIYIIINNTTVYTKLEDFRSPVALSLYKEYVVLQQNFQKKTDEIDLLREKYATAQDKKPLAEKILQEESTLNLLEKSMTSKLNDYIKEENEFLKK